MFFVQKQGKLMGSWNFTFQVTVPVIKYAASVDISCIAVVMCIKNFKDAVNAEKVSVLISDYCVTVSVSVSTRPLPQQLSPALESVIMEN